MSPHDSLIFLLHAHAHVWRNKSLPFVERWRACSLINNAMANVVRSHGLTALTVALHREVADGN